MNNLHCAHYTLVYILDHDTQFGHKRKRFTAPRLLAKKSNVMPPKKTATVKKTVVASNSLSRAARASPAPRKKTGRDEGVKAPDMSDTSSEHSVCPICENVIVDAGETSAGEDAIYCE